MNNSLGEQPTLHGVNLMANKVTITMNDVPVGLDSMYVRVEEDALTAGVRNVLHSGVQAVTGNTIDINIGENGTVGNGAIISADNYTSGGAAFKAMSGYSLIEAGEAALNFDNILFMGSSTTARAFGQTLDAQDIDRVADMQSMLAAQGVAGLNLVTEAQSGSSAGFQADTVMPEAVTNNAGLTNVLFWGQAPSNSVGGGAYSEADPSSKAALQSDIESILDQAASAGWTPVYSNFNNTPSKDLDPLWNTEFLKDIVDVKAPLSIDGSEFIQDYEALGGWSNYLFSADDGIHLAEGPGDRIYRQFSATRIARLLGNDLRKDLSGRRVVVSMAGSVPPVDLDVYDNITPMLLGYIGEDRLCCSANLIDADTGEILPDLYVAVKGATTSRTGKGNAGNTSSSYLNDTALSRSLRMPPSQLAGMRLEIGSFSQTIPSVSKLIIAGSSSLPNKITDWECNGETKTLTADDVPCGAVEFLNVPIVDNKINALGTIPVGSEHAYLSAIEIQFA